MIEKGYRRLLTIDLDNPNGVGKGEAKERYDECKWVRVADVTKDLQSDD